MNMHIEAKSTGYPGEALDLCPIAMARKYRIYEQPSDQPRIDNVISESIVDLLFQVGDSVNIDLRPIVKSFDASHRLNEQKLQALPRVNTSALYPMYRECTTVLFRHAFSRTGLLPATYDEQQIFGSCMINCDNLQHAITTAVNFFNLLNGQWGEIAIARGNGYVRFSINIGRQKNYVPSLYVDMIGICFFYKLFSWLIGRPLCVSQINIAHKKLLDDQLLIELGADTIRFDMHENSFCFSERLLLRPIVRTRSELRDTLQTVPFEFMNVLPKLSLSNRVEKIFKTALMEKSRIPSLEEVASLLAHSAPTLRRHLAQRNQSFQSLLDKCRMEHAIELLGQTSSTIDEISCSLGFSAPSGFSRAFKDWTGQPPSSYRNMLRAGSVLT